MSSQRFELLDEDLEDLLDKISKRLEIGISIKESDEERKRKIMKLDQSLDEARNFLSKMEIEARQAPVKFQRRMNSKILKYSNEIQRHRKKVNDLRYENVNLNYDVSSVPDLTSDNLQDNIRRQILMGTSSLDRTSESLARSHVIALETEQVGTEVLGELGTQRETLQRTRERLTDTQEEISRSKRILRSIGKNFFFNKILLIIIIILEGFILAGLIYWKFFM